MGKKRVVGHEMGLEMMPMCNMRISFGPINVHLAFRFTNFNTGVSDNQSKDIQAMSQPFQSNW